MTQTLTQEQNAWRWKVLLSTYVGYMGYYLTRKVFTVCKLDIRAMLGGVPNEATAMGHGLQNDAAAMGHGLQNDAAAMGHGLQMVAHIWTAYLVAYAIGMLTTSFVGRKLGARVVLLGGLAVSMGCNIVFGFADSYATFLAFMFVNGLVQATGWPGVLGCVSRWLRTKERGQIMGFWSTNYLIGNFVLKWLAGYLLHGYGWRFAFFGCTAVTLGIWWLLYFWAKERPEDVGIPPIADDDVDPGRAVTTADKDQISFREYLQVALNPIVLLMGSSYFCVKFLRYALDSWLPTFLALQGLPKDQAAYFSSIYDLAGFPGAILAGLALDRLFRGNWAALCFTMCLGAIGGYLSVIYFGTSPRLIALYFGIVGFMIYGPDTLLCGAASVAVAGRCNALAVAGIVNGVGSIGSIVQEEVIGYLMRGDVSAGIANVNRLYLVMSVLLACCMLAAMVRLRWVRRNAPRPADSVTG